MTDVRLDFTVSSKRYTFKFSSSPPVWKYELYGDNRGSTSFHSLSRKLYTAGELSFSWPDGGSLA
jgi:hypothetical protein